MADFPYRVDKRLIIIPVRLTSPTHYADADFVLDTGASYTVVDYRLAQALGYSASDAIAPSRVSSALGREEGYRIRLAGIEALGRNVAPFEIACHSLLEQGVQGLLGMSFLEQFRFCVDPAHKVISIA